VTGELAPRLLLDAHGRPYDGRMVDRHVDGSVRVELTDGNTVRLRPAPDGRTTLSIIGPAGGHHASVRLSDADLNRMIGALAMSVAERVPRTDYRDAMTP
jgi:hypothetical protein